MFFLSLLISKAVGMKLLHKIDNPEEKVNYLWLLIRCMAIRVPGITVLIDVCNICIIKIMIVLLSLIMIAFQYTVAKLGYGPVLELTYNYGVTNYDKGNGYAQVYSILFLFSEEGFNNYYMVLHECIMHVVIRMWLFCV